jgi:two-component system, cell cycle sensor histidine kinase and response regulator CckA
MPSPNAERPKMSNSQKTALVVDDELDDLEALRVPLAADGFNVLTASEGKSARALFNTNRDAIDVLVSDVAMSPMSGTELALHLLDQKPGLPVVFVSGHVGAQALRNDILSVTTIAFLRKPFTPEELLAKVREVIQVSTSR